MVLAELKNICKNTFHLHCMLTMFALFRLVDDYELGDVSLPPYFFLILKQLFFKLFSVKCLQKRD